LVENDGRLPLYHGWVDRSVVPQPTLAYYQVAVIADLRCPQRKSSETGLLMKWRF